MVQAYNFLASWQLFPEKCNYEWQLVPKSGYCKIESIKNGKALSVDVSWVNLENDAYYTQYSFVPDGSVQLMNEQTVAEFVKAEIINASTLQINFFKNDCNILTLTHEILANGFLKVTQHGINEENNAYTNILIYHKQMSVMPYASSLSGVAIRPTKEGVIKHKALSAMEEQTNMQLNQIKEQIELLARQAQEIKKRKELSLMIYEAKLNFKPQIGSTYHLYEKKDGTHILSLVAPKEWGGNGPFKQFISSVQLLADHTWREM